MLILISNLDHFRQADDFRKWLRQRLEAADIITA